MKWVQSLVPPVRPVWHTLFSQTFLWNRAYFAWCFFCKLCAVRDEISDGGEMQTTRWPIILRLCILNDGHESCRIIYLLISMNSCKKHYSIFASNEVHHSSCYAAKCFRLLDINLMRRLHIMTYQKATKVIFVKLTSFRWRHLSLCFSQMRVTNISAYQFIRGYLGFPLLKCPFK